jgi:putative transposase
MYDYRKMSPEERREVLEARRARGMPLHAPPHIRETPGEYFITATCYEHRHIFEHPDDLSLLADETLDAFAKAEIPCATWVFLPNHYHVLLETKDLSIVSELLRLLHSRVATTINGHQQQRGRQVWYRFSDRLIRSPRHHWATMNYIHYNPIKHGYVDRMSLWAWSSVHNYADAYGKEWLAEKWHTYPIDQYSEKWDRE